MGWTNTAEWLGGIIFCNSYQDRLSISKYTITAFIIEYWQRLKSDSRYFQVLIRQRRTYWLDTGKNHEEEQYYRRIGTKNKTNANQEWWSTTRTAKKNKQLKPCTWTQTQARKRKKKQKQKEYYEQNQKQPRINSNTNRKKLSGK